MHLSVISYENDHVVALVCRGETVTRQPTVSHDAESSICQYLLAFGIFGVLRGRRVCNKLSRTCSASSLQNNRGHVVSAYHRVHPFASSRRARTDLPLLRACSKRVYYCKRTRRDGGRCEPGPERVQSSGVRVTVVV